MSANIYAADARDQIEEQLGGWHEMHTAIARYILLGEKPSLPEGLDWGEVARTFVVPQFVHAYALLLAASVIK